MIIKCVWGDDSWQQPMCKKIPVWGKTPNMNSECKNRLFHSLVGNRDMLNRTVTKVLLYKEQLPEKTVEWEFSSPMLPAQCALDDLLLPA